MDPATILYQFSGALDVTAEDLAQVDAELEEVRAVIQGTGLWSRLGYCRNRLDVHVNSLKSLALRARRASEELDNPPAKGPL